jgi:hypothetical protein
MQKKFLPHFLPTYSSSNASQMPAIIFWDEPESFFETLRKFILM